MNIGVNRESESTTRALEGGPLAMGTSTDVLITGDQLSDIPNDESVVPGASVKDEAKKQKRLAREEKSQRAALEAHQARARAMHENSRPKIMRDK